MMARPAESDAQGFTLIELLIAMVIGGMLLAVAATALTLGMRTTTEATEHIEGSASIQLASSWLLTDVQSARSNEIMPEQGGCDASGDPVVSFGAGAAGVSSVWSYSGGTLYRAQCGGGETTVAVGLAGKPTPSPGPPFRLSWSWADSDAPPVIIEVAPRAAP